MTRNPKKLYVHEFGFGIQTLLSTAKVSKEYWELYMNIVVVARYLPAAQ
jgi:hypothetical protein